MKRFLLFLVFVTFIIPKMFAENDSNFYISKIIIEGNKITHNKIILRELTFKAGDTIKIENYETEKKKSADNLMNISIFNFVSITESISSNEISILIKVTERWYIWPIPVFDLADRNFNTWWKTKDFDRVNYGVDLAIYNFRGRSETLDLLLSLGYDEKYGIIYKIPYINKKQKIGLVFSTNFIRSHEVALKDSNNKVVFYKNNDFYPKQSLSSSIGLTYRNNIHNTHSIQFGIENYKFSDSLLQKNENYTVDNQNKLNYFTLYYQFKNDYRNYKPYPLQGHYFDIEITKYGLFSIYNKSTDFVSFKSTFRKYFKINEKLYFASGLTGMINSKLPYYIQNGLGYVRDYVRGYEYYVINGQGFTLIKNNLKYAIVSQKIAKIKAIKTEKFNTIPFAFYLNLYADAAYVYKPNEDKYNSLVNKPLIGFGLGLDFVTYYDKVLRLEYSINKSGEKGVFIHFMTSI